MTRGNNDTQRFAQQAGTSTTPVPFADLWRRAVTAAPAAPFLTFEAPDGTVTDWSYGDFDAVVGRTAGRLAEAGVRRGCGVHLALTNSPTFVAVWLATNRLGAFIVPSDPMATSPELAEHLSRTGPVAGFCARGRSSTYREAVASSGLDLTVFDVDEADSTLAWTNGATPPNDSPQPSPDDRAAIMFTSGTTGRPKGVEISQANYTFAGTTMAAAADLTSRSRQIVVLPLFHANAQYYSFASAIAVGAGVALVYAFSASGFIGQARRHRATHASLFAGPMRMILARTDADTVEPAGLEHCWFAQNLAPDQYETLSAWLGCRPRQLYGMTETIPAVLTDERDRPLCDVMGYVTPGCEVDLQDAAGASCAPGEVGEIVVGGRAGETIFTGYLDDPETTAASFRDGWFLTGDRATRDEHGRYRFDGRRSDVLKVSGENVSVVEVEAVLCAHPEVLEAVVVGAPDPVRDEVPVAFVVPAGVADGTTYATDVARAELIERLEAWVGDRLGKAKRPHRYFVTDELPRTSVGKIRKFLLTEAARDDAGPATEVTP